MPHVSFILSNTKALQLMNKPGYNQVQKNLCGAWQYLVLPSVLTTGRGYLSHTC